MKPKKLPPNAKFVDLSSGSAQLSDRVGGRNRVDYFRFDLRSRSSFDLRGLKRGMSAQLLNGTGGNIRSYRSSATPMSKLLDAGIYYIKVSASRGQAATRYKLRLKSQVDREWRAAYFNSVDLSGAAVFDQPLGYDSKFSRTWGTGSPGGNLVDNFTARFTTQRNLSAGLYKFQVNADDGIRVRVGDQILLDYWNSPIAKHTRFFYLPGGETPISVEYREDGGDAYVNFDMVPVSQIDENPDSSKDWVTNVYTWNGQAKPSVNFYNDSNNKIGRINLGSNQRSDGWKGVSFDVGRGALRREIDRLPDDTFAFVSYTQADFTGERYKFTVKADDGFRLFAKNINNNQWFYITPENEWQEAYGYREIKYALPQGRYDLHYAFFEAGGDANFDLSWSRDASISQRGLDLISGFEGKSLTVYQDGDKPAIGFGHIIHDEAELAEYKRNGITEKRAYELLRSDATRYERAVNQLVTVALSQNQFDALVSFTFNLGPRTLAESDLLQKLNLGMYDQVPSELEKYIKVNGVPTGGLLRRRKAEAALFTSPG
jgi:GH24 family phage-related lysozyme (muramidase)